MERIKVGMIDDDPDGLNVLKYWIEMTEFFDVAFAETDPIKGLELLKNRSADILITDIIMDKMNGLQLASMVESLGIPVIICSAHDKYGYEGFKVNAIDFVKKPVNYAELITALNKTRDTNVVLTPVQEIVIKKNLIFIPENGSNSFSIVDIYEIQFIKQEGNYSEIHTGERKYLYQVSLKSLLDVLPSLDFQRTHKSYAVNINELKCMFSDRVVLKSGTPIPVGRTFYNALNNMLKGRSLL